MEYVGTRPPSGGVKKQAPRLSNETRPTNVKKMMEAREKDETRTQKLARKLREKRKRDKLMRDLYPWNKVYFPSQRVILVHPPTPDPSASELHFRVPPSMSKHEIKDFLQQVHGFAVKKINTVNYLGKLKYPMNSTHQNAKAYRRPSYKKAIVFIDPPAPPVASVVAKPPAA